MGQKNDLIMRRSKTTILLAVAACLFGAMLFIGIGRMWLIGMTGRDIYVEVPLGYVGPIVVRSGVSGGIRESSFKREVRYKLSNKTRVIEFAGWSPFTAASGYRLHVHYPDGTVLPFGEPFRTYGDDTLRAWHGPAGSGFVFFWVCTEGDLQLLGDYAFESLTSVGELPSGFRPKTLDELKSELDP